MKKQLRGGRINRINPLIQQIISNEFLRNSDSIINKSTITHVSTSPDMKRSTIYVSNIENNNGQLISALDKNRTKIQKELGKQLTTKFVPRIQFEIDNTFEHVDKINKIINIINE
ncbi:MAG: 30S ribosome-binding factor RbfA [Actinomycetota bacterium]|nr:30S ribosome-binding factor RbfA [Actinomycetota bacterium]|tara:strand:- start:697 stop:1041 length:345 start_codon:yes stop_codon:yes gene_type:complete